MKTQLMSNGDTILEFLSATLAADGGPSVALSDCSLALRAGELALVRFDSRAGHGPMADAAMGLIEPSAGRVTFRGEDWRSMRSTVASHNRGKIGRFFGKRGWVYHLDLDENVTLRERHRSHRPTADIYAEADRLANALGLVHGLPTERPGRVDLLDLQRAACVRMLLGSPPLVIVDEPNACLMPALHEPLIDQIGRARRRGTAVLWLTADPSIWESAAIGPTVKIDQSGKQEAVARLDTAFGLAFLPTDAVADVTTAAAPQAGH